MRAGNLGFIALALALLAASACTYGEVRDATSGASLGATTVEFQVPDTTTKPVPPPGAPPVVGPVYTAAVTARAPLVSTRTWSATDAGANGAAGIYYFNEFAANERRDRSKSYYVPAGWVRARVKKDGYDSRVFYRNHLYSNCLFTVPVSPMVHDCAITERYFVLLDLPVVFAPEVIERGGAFPYLWKPENGARVGLMPREGNAEDVVWSEVDPCYVFHPMNAYDDADGRVVLDVARHPKMFATDMRGPGEGPPTFDRWIVDPKGGQVKEQRIDERGQEFPRHDERLVGRPYRYGYTAMLGKGDAISFGGLLKHDLRDGKSEVHHEGSARTFMEPVFVPAHDGAAEDEGYVMAYVHDASTDKCDVVILHAQDFASEPVATIHLPTRVPYGFHGNWVPAQR